MNKTLLTSLFALAAVSAYPANIWRAPVSVVEEGDWNDSVTWVDGNIPASSDTASLDKSDSITNVNSNTSIADLNLYSGALNVSSGNFNQTNAYLYAGEFNLYGTAVMTASNVFNSGDFGDLGYITDTESRINIYGEATLNAGTWGAVIGERANLQNVVANFYGKSTINTTNGGNGLKIGASRDNATTTSATTVLNVYEKSTVNATTLYFYRNATLNVYGDATLTASQKAYIGDSKTDSVANMNLGGSSRTTLSSYSFVFNYANLTVKDNATLTLN